MSGSCSSAFKGYADSTGATPYNDGGTWTARPGASGNPPSSLPTYMAVITTAAANKGGATISGTISHVVIVKVGSATLSPGSSATGKVVAVLS